MEYLIGFVLALGVLSLARVTGLSRPEAGLANRALVAEKYAEMLSPGVYRLTSWDDSGRAEPHNADDEDEIDAAGNQGHSPPHPGLDRELS